VRADTPMIDPGAIVIRPTAPATCPAGRAIKRPSPLGDRHDLPSGQYPPPSDRRSRSSYLAPSPVDNDATLAMQPPVASVQLWVPSGRRPTPSDRPSRPSHLEPCHR